MKKEVLSQIISRIDEKYIEEATVFASDSRRATGSPGALPGKTIGKPSRSFRWGVLAACLVLIAAIGSAGFALAAEVREYNHALAFFEENGLSAEGLSRADVKAVYRDITQKTFSYGKTAEVIRQAVPGWEILQHEPTPEELAALWDKNVWRNAPSEKGISYRIDFRYIYDEQGSYRGVEKSVLECYRDGEILWKAEFRDFSIRSYAHTNEGTMLWGESERSSAFDPLYGWIALVDGEGSIVWQRRLDHGFQNERVAFVLANGDGTWAVLSRGDFRYLCLSRYDAEGKELSFHQTEMGNYGIQNAAKLGDGYILQLRSQRAGDAALLYKMDREGNLTDSFSYEEDGLEYYITDMAEYEGQVYLSAYGVPRQGEYGGRREIAGILEYAFACLEAGRWDIPSEELTPVVRENYTAILLICDPEGGAPRTFYSVKGSLGGSLTVGPSGQLEWNVESITTTFFSPATSSFTIGGNCAVFCYTFDAEGRLTGQRDTGESVPYRR